MEESKLIERAKEGDQAALATLVKKYEKTIFNFAFKICRDRDKAENTMQETFLRFVKNLKQFDGKSKLSTWLYRIVVNNCMMDARKRQRRPFVEPKDDERDFEERFVADRLSAPTATVENDELKRVLDEAISKLDPSYRVVFMLRDVERLSTEETAEAIGVSEPAVKSRLHRARSFLRNEITKAFQS